MRPPCRDCLDRRPATRTEPICHADCERYRAFWDENRRRNKENLMESDLDGMKIEGMRKADRITRLVKGKTYQTGR